MTELRSAVPQSGPVYRRVLLKLSGEVFGGGKVGVDPDVVQSIARQVAEVVAAGTQVAIVVGGGNFFRGAELSQRGMDRDRADYMGMLGTVLNCLESTTTLPPRPCRRPAPGTSGPTPTSCGAPRSACSPTMPRPFRRRSSSSGAGVRR